MHGSNKKINNKHWGEKCAHEKIITVARLYARYHDIIVHFIMNDLRFFAPQISVNRAETHENSLTVIDFT